MKKYKTIREAANGFVEELSAIPRSLLIKLKDQGEEIVEITPPAVGDYVYLYSSNQGEIVSIKDGLYSIKEHNSDSVVKCESGDFEVQRDDYFPMWGTLWTFDSTVDRWWLEERNGLQLMADCGFRIYEQEDYGFVFGIDGAGYDFYEDHWIPLYRARGLKWHEEE